MTAEDVVRGSEKADLNRWRIAVEDFAAGIIIAAVVAVIVVMAVGDDEPSTEDQLVCAVRYGEGSPAYDDCLEQR